MWIQKRLYFRSSLSSQFIEFLHVLPPDAADRPPESSFSPILSCLSGFFKRFLTGGVPSPPQTEGCGAARPLGTPPKKLLFVFSTGQKPNSQSKTQFWPVFEGFCRSFSPFPLCFPRQTQKRCGFSHMVFHIFHRVFHTYGENPVIPAVIKTTFPANFGAFPCLFAFFIKSRPAFSVLFSVPKSHSPERNFSVPSFPHRAEFSTPGTAGALFHTFVKNRLWKSPFPHREQRSKTIRFCVISPQKIALLWGAVPGQRRAAVAMQSQRDAAGGKRPVCRPANAKDPLSFAHFYIILWKISIAIWK